LSPETIDWWLITGYIVRLFDFGVCRNRRWHCIGSLTPRSAAVSRLPHIFFTSPVPRAVAPPSAHRHLFLELVLLGAHRPGAREAFERPP
jgi:hypothetical protein